MHHKVGEAYKWFSSRCLGKRELNLNLVNPMSILLHQNSARRLVQFFSRTPRTFNRVGVGSSQRIFKADRVVNFQMLVNFVSQTVIGASTVTHDRSSRFFPCFIIGKSVALSLFSTGTIKHSPDIRSMPPKIYCPSTLCPRWYLRRHMMYLRW